MKLLEYVLDYIDKGAIKYTVWNWHRKRAVLENDRNPYNWEDHCKSCDDWNKDCICL
jgi:hypothetical protein